jgi:hypothetical protein
MPSVENHLSPPTVSFCIAYDGGHAEIHGRWNFAGPRTSYKPGKTIFDFWEYRWVSLTGFTGIHHFTIRAAESP